MSSPGSTNSTGSIGSNRSMSSSEGGVKPPRPTMMAPLRSESLAYPKSPTSNLFSWGQFMVRQHAQKIVATTAFVVFILFISSEYMYHGDGSSGFLRGGTAIHFGGAFYPGYFRVQDSVVDSSTFMFAAVTDLDQLSRVKGEKLQFESKMLSGSIHRNDKTNQYTIQFDPDMRTLITKHNEAGRGAEFSELTIYQDRLLTFDDRTGDVFEILNDPDGENSYVAPRFVITEGSGDTDKGMKWEWSTVKDGILYIGSMGKEYTRPDGSIQNTNNLWIATLDKTGAMTRIDWAKQYNFVRDALGASAPGYVIHEAVNWSPYLKKWIFLPRRVSAEAYDENKDERMGSNKLVLVDEHFTTTQIVDVKMKDKDGLHGFSSFAFVPNSNDRHAMAIRSVEEDCVGGDDDVCKQRSYLLVFDVLSGEVLLDEVEIEVKMKFEGLEFVDVHKKPPSH